MSSPPQNEPLIAVRSVSKRFKRFHAQRSFQQRFIELFTSKKTTHSDDFFWSLQDVSVDVSRGEKIGIIGHNGSGKSTLLKLISGVLEPTHGDIIVNGRISSLLELGAGFHPELTGRENIILNATLHGLKRKTIDERLDSIVRFAGLEEFIDTPVKHYSSGMYMRLGFSVAFHTDPDLLVVDEVLAVGDSAFQKKCMTAIHHFCQQGGTLVLVTHDLNAVETLCNRVIWMDKGEVRQVGRPIDVIGRYLSAMSRVDADSGDTSNADTAAAETKLADRRIGNLKVEFTDVKLCGVSGDETSIFNHGQAMEIHLSYMCRESVVPPVIGIGIHHENGTHVTGPNTAFDNVELPDTPTGTVVYRVASLALLPGNYLLTVAAVHGVTQEIYDIHDRFYEFRVDDGSSRERYGLVSLRGTWEIEDGRPGYQSTEAPSDDVHNASHLVPEAHL